jgi:hypothetical protein
MREEEKQESGVRSKNEDVANRFKFSFWLSDSWLLDSVLFHPSFLLYHPPVKMRAKLRIGIIFMTLSKILNLLPGTTT